MRRDIKLGNIYRIVHTDWQNDVYLDAIGYIEELPDKRQATFKLCAISVKVDDDDYTDNWWESARAIVDGTLLGNTETHPEYLL